MHDKLDKIVDARGVKPMITKVFYKTGILDSFGIDHNDLNHLHLHF
jgi:hypothetical protein